MRGRAPTHGHSHRGKQSPTYNSWRGMIGRCKPNGQYGHLSICVCERWRVFANFLADMGERPKGMELDRINDRGNYEPDNCRWFEIRANRQKRRSVVMTPEKRVRAYELRATGVVYSKIAVELGVSKRCVKALFSGEAWRPNDGREIPRPPAEFVA